MNSWNNLAIFIYGNTSSFYSVSASSIQFQPSDSQHYTTRFQYFHWIKQTGLIQRKRDLENARKAKEKKKKELELERQAEEKKKKELELKRQAEEKVI